MIIKCFCEHLIVRLDVGLLNSPVLHRLERYNYQHCLIAPSVGMISVWFLTFVGKAFGSGLFLDHLNVSWAETNRVVQVKYTNPSNSDVAHSLNTPTCIQAGKYDF